MMIMSLTWGTILRLSLLLLILGLLVAAFATLPIEKILRDFLIWIDQNLGHWGPLVLAIAYIPLTILAVPASVLTLGGGYLFGLPVGFVADSVGATIGSVAAFILGSTIAKSYVVSKMNDYPQFQAVTIAIQRSGFKIALLLRLAPLVPFNVLNYLLSVTPIGIWEYTLASWLGMMPITLILVYVGTTLKDLSDVTHGWSALSPTRWVSLAWIFLPWSMVLMVCATKVARTALDKALAENEEIEGMQTSPDLPIVTDSNSTSDLRQPLLIKIETLDDTQ
ncbi:hypothetical protein Syun_007621 [Stephania yunnanensis]|uniref:VTT domain-containing protein n=1 Tax=Stephania yunnanensis TaxID=152371 RepID=A0AAP0L1E3_9MAGN